jgi:hypothetical protein
MSGDAPTAGARRRSRRQAKPDASRGQVDPIEPRPDDPLPEPVDRDNCPRCATRFDIGCRHRRAPLSMGAW